MKRCLQILCLAIILGVPLTSLPATPLDGAVSSGRVEAVLANEHRKDMEKIIKEFAEARLTHLHVQFMKVGKPPTNIGLGPLVTAGRARAAIQMAKTYNR